jgi:paraquat-inducible protein B
MTVEKPDDTEGRADPATSESGTALPRLVGLAAIGGLLLIAGFFAAAASGRIFRQERTFVVFFKNPVPLKAGGPVTFRQTALGSVREVELVFTGRGFDSEIMVVFDVDRGSLRSIGGGEQPLNRASDKEFAEALTKAGIRGTVRSSSPVGGQKSLDFDFHPEIEGRLAGLPSRYPELPTGSVSRLDIIQAKVENALEKISDLPVEDVIVQLRSTLESAQKLLDNGDLRGALANLRHTLDSANRMLARTDAMMNDADGLLAEVRTTLSSTNATMKTTDATLKRLDATLLTVDRNVERTADTQYQTIRSIDELNELLRTVRQLVDTLQQHPESLLQGKPAPKEKK